MRRFSAFYTRLVASLVAGGSLSILLAPALSTNAMAAGMPQMEFDNPLVVAQFFWVLVIFFILFLAVKYFSIPQIEQVIHDRRSKIDTDMESARKAKQQADKAVDTLNATRREAALEAKAKIDNILQTSREEATANMHELHARLTQETKETEARIDAAKQQALGQVDQMARDVAQTLVQKMLKEDVDAKLIDSKISQILSTKPS